MEQSTAPKSTGMRIQISNGLSVCLWRNYRAQPRFGLKNDEYIHAHVGRRILKRKHQVYFGPGEFQAIVGVYQLLNACSQGFGPENAIHSNYYSEAESTDDSSHMAYASSTV